MSSALITFLVSKGVEQALFWLNRLEENKQEELDLNQLSTKELAELVRSIDIGDAEAEFEAGTESVRRP